MTKTQQWILAVSLSALSCGASLAADAPAAAAPATAAPAAAVKVDKNSLEAKITRAGYTQGKQVDSVPDYRIDGWNYIDSKHLIFNSGPGSSYLLTLMIDCPDLSASDDIGFTTTTSFLTKHDAVKVQTAGSDIPRTCPIVSITELSKIPKKKK